MSLLMAISILFFSVTLNKTKYANAAVSAGEDYSQKDNGNIVLSVEKVGIISTGEDYEETFSLSNYPFKTELYTSDTKDKTLKSLYVDDIYEKSADSNLSGYSTTTEETREYPSYYYMDIASNSKNKTVYTSGAYIMLENSLKTVTKNEQTFTYYYNPALKAYDTNGAVDMAEGVLFTFGSQIFATPKEGTTNTTDGLYNNTTKLDETTINNYDLYKDIQQINVTATRNGEAISLPAVRQYGANNYQDFTFIIPQKSGYDGHYEFVVEYRHNEEFKRQTFSFDLVFKSTYTEPESFGSGHSYSTLPKLILPVRRDNTFILGESKQYPRLEYDFSKYTLDYTHTLNGVTTTYSYRTVKNGSLTNLVGTITNSNGTRTETIPLNGENKAVFVFTEIGHYVFSYDYIYDDEQNSMGFEIKDEMLDIYGFELKYSKIGYTDAQMTYITITKNTTDEVVLVVPNGYEKDVEPTDQTSLGVVYSVDETDTVGRYTGEIDSDKTQDSLVSTGNSTPVIKPTNLTYQTTNQGGISLKSNVNYIGESSYYYYSENKITETLDEKYKKSLTNSTSFNEYGYYILVVNFKINESSYYQLFAFVYTNSTSSVKVNALTLDEKGESTKEYTTPIGVGQFTNQNVKITWDLPGVFERKISVSYYSNPNVYLSKDTSKLNGSTILTSDELLKQAIAVPIEYGAILGSDIVNGEGASFLIESTNEGQAKAYTSFTVDRTSITGVKMYAVSKYGTANSVKYVIKSDVNGYAQQVDSISDSETVISWNDKSSGAQITATYYYMPIISGKESIAEIYNTQNEVWFTNGYKLGNQSGPFKINRSETLGTAIDSSNIIKNAGIYLFELTDDAGNSCVYMFILDNTEQYFKVNGKFYTRENLVFSENQTVEFATHKAIKISSDESSEVLTFVSLFAENKQQDLTNKGYFVGSGSNIGTLQNLFKSTGGSPYLTVKNKSLVLYNQYDLNCGTVSVEKTSINTNPSYLVDSSKKVGEAEQNANEYMRKLNLFGINQINSAEQESSTSYLWVEINDDHSYGKVHFATDESLLSNEDNLGVANTLSTGAGDNGILGAQATGDAYVAFYWTDDVGDYNITELNCYYYELTESFNAEKYFYTTEATKTFDLIKDKKSATYNQNQNRYYALLNPVDNQTKAGLYVVERIYNNNDATKRSYWFIVDRTGITDSSAFKDVKIRLLNESDYSNFDKYGASLKNFVIGDETIYYTVSVSTNKVPAVISVPVGKYFDGSKVSRYYAGRLNVTLYFLDTQSQISDEKKPYKLFDSKQYINLLTDESSYYKNTNYLSIDIKEYLTNSKSLGKNNYLYEKLFSYSDIETNWIWLQGDYVLVIEDNTQSSSGANKETIGFSIKNTKPSTDVFATTKENDNLTNSVSQAERVNNSEFDYELYTNAEFVKLNLQAYDESSTDAQVDPGYLVVKQYIDGIDQGYYYYYKHGNSNSAQKQYDATGTVLLDTGLVRNEDGTINLTNNHKIEYYITIRFNITSDIQASSYDEKYKNCYQYYKNGNLTPFYETVYHVVIDRIPPTTNTQYLEENDSLVGYYNEESGLESMFDIVAIENASGLYFVNRYTAYYEAEGNQTSKLYAFKVNASTPFSWTDVGTVYYRTLDDKFSSISLPVTSFTSYSQINSTIKTFGDAGLDNGIYYEMIELDKAGNMTQYIILYSNLDSDISSLPQIGLNATYIYDSEIKTDTNVTLSSNNNSLTLFEIDTINDDENYVFVGLNGADKFFHIEISCAGEVLKTINTNVETSFEKDGLSAEICELIKTNGFGNYNIKIMSRDETLAYTINYFDQEHRVELNVHNLVKIADGKYYIELAGANETQDSITYYATEVKVVGIVNGVDGEYVYKCKVGESRYDYYLVNGEEGTTLGSPVATIYGLSGTYQIILTDVFGNKSTYRFDTENGDIFHSISFDGEGNYFESANYYYSYTTATINFNTSLYKEFRYVYSVDGKQVNGTIVKPDDPAGNIVNIDSYIDCDWARGQVVLKAITTESVGKIVEYSISLFYNDEVEYTYHVVIDTYTGKVFLKNTSNESHQMDVEYNKTYSEVSCTSTASGIMNLMWSEIENDYFNYDFKLYEQMNDNNHVEHDLNDYTNYVINTSADSKGVYWFVIEVSTKEGKPVGNKVFAFSVIATLNDLYYVRTEDMISISSNASFKFGEDLSLTDSQKAFLGIANETLPIVKIPLYISNSELTVVVAKDQGAKVLSTASVKYLNDRASLTIYRVYTNTYSRYLATLVVKPDANNQIVSGVKLGDELVKDFNQTIYVHENQTVSLTFNQTSADSANITKKNSIVINVYHNDILLESKVCYNLGNSVNYTIQGSGDYRFEICDLAGNVHSFMFEEQNGNEIAVTVVKNIYFTMNGNAPIENAVFNDGVELVVVNPYTYDSINSSPIEVIATRNGEKYIPTQKGFAYLFEEFGSYSVTFKASYTNNNEKETVTGSISFTILNKNEATLSYDLTSVMRYKILKVQNQNGDEITTEFINMITQNGKLLDYSTLMSNSNELGITAGKQTITINYYVEDGIYPAREAEFSFTLNDEIPTIECSVELGKTTTKGFEILFNPGMIFEQVGDSYLYIKVGDKDILVCEINQDSTLSQITYKIEQKVDGAGDYYVRLQGSSGNIIKSFKVVVKEPLNVWAIIIIVVVSVIVLGVTITIIVLRNKMRIR